MLPRFDVTRRHALRIPARPETVWEALLRHRFGTSRIGRLLMALRGYGWSRTRSREAEGLSEGLARFGFVKVEEAPGRELVFGLVGRFWRPRGDLRAVARARLLSRATMRNIRQNLFLAFAYNVLSIPVAAGVLYPFLGVLITPIWASAAMTLSSLSVVGNALRLRNVTL